MTENELQKQTISLIKMYGWQYTHLGYRGKQRRGYSSNNNGLPDLMIFADGGRVFLIELKVDKNKLKNSQKERFQQLTDLDHAVHVCRSIDEVIDALNPVAYDKNYYGLNNG